MEWLEFPRWSPEVERQLALQAARLGAAVARRTLHKPGMSATVAAAYRLNTMLREYPRTNPWGHPTTEC